MLGQQRHASKTPFKWRFPGGPIMTHLKWYMDPSSPHQLTKMLSKLDPLWQNCLDPRMECEFCLVINDKLRPIFGILTFISMINSTSKS